MIRLSQACLGPEEIEAVTRVLQGHYLGMGQEVRLFEEELQNFIGSETKVACVNTGTSALQLAVQACGIGSGDEVIVPSLTYVASFQAVSATGAKPIACDIDLATGCIDVQDARRYITPKTKAIMPVHYGSGMGDLEGVYNLAREYNLRVIEDAAHSFGGTYKNKPVGAEGDVVCFSFDGIKNVTCAEGGAVVSRDKSLIEKIYDLRLLGVERDTEKRYLGLRSWDFQVRDQGWRYHMSNIYAAIGRAQLKKIDYFRKTRAEYVSLYRQALQDQPVKFLNMNYHDSLCHIFPIQVDAEKRDALKDYLWEHSIETGIHYKPNHLLELFAGTDCPKATQFWHSILTLPLHSNLSSQDVLLVVNTIKDFFATDAR